MKLHNTTWVVTGATGGIGEALVTQLLQRGARVAALDISEEKLSELRTKTGAGDELSLHTSDITDRATIAALPETVIAHHQTVDGVINCAGIIQPFVKINELDFSAIERVMNINFYGTLNVTKAFLPYLLKRPEGYVANVSSMGGFLPVPGQSAYGASKAAVKLLTEGLYAELLSTNVHVSTIFPGATKTDISKNSGVQAPGDTSDDSSFPMLPASDAARIMLDGIEKNKPQIFTGKDSRTMNKLYRMAPVWATKLITKQMGSLLK